jgi:hypothetical protein
MYTMASATTLPSEESQHKTGMVVYYSDEHGSGIEIPALHLEFVVDSHGITEEFDRTPVASQTWEYLLSLWKYFFCCWACFV